MILMRGILAATKAGSGNPSGRTIAPTSLPGLLGSREEISSLGYRFVFIEMYVRTSGVTLHDFSHRYPRTL